MNVINVIGRWVRDCELKYSQGGTAVLKNTIAINRPFSKEKETDYVDVTVFGKIAENTANYTGKGSLVGITGRIQQDKWETQEGEKRSKVGIVASSVEFLQSNQQSSNNVNGSNERDEMDEFEGFSAMDDDEDIPF